MRILDRLIIAIFALFILFLSVCIILIPFNIYGPLSINSIAKMVLNMDRNYYYTLGGIFLFIASIRIIFSGFSRKTSKTEGPYLITRNEYGDVVIYASTIVGLVQHVVEKFSGINNIKTRVNLSEGQVKIELTGDVLPEISIPEVTKELQSMVKEYIENATGAKVSEVKVMANNVSSPNRLVR